MLISSDANAAQAQVPQRSTRFYDDIGCLAADADARADGTVRYVQLASGGWAPAESAWYGISRDIKTPMDYGVLAYSSSDEAQRADRDREARRWSSIIGFGEGR